MKPDISKTRRPPHPQTTAAGEAIQSRKDLEQLEQSFIP